LEQVEKVNSFSRSLKDRTLSYQEAMAGLKDIAALDGYGYVLKLIVQELLLLYMPCFLENGPGSMCVFFNRHCYICHKRKITQAGVFEFFEYFASGVAAGALSTLAIKLFPFMDLYRIIIASIIILLPVLP